MSPEPMALVMLGLLVAWFVIAHEIGKVAGRKGRSRNGFFVLALLLPVVSWIIVMTKAPTKDSATSNALASGHGRKCPHCAEIVKAEARICRFCHQALVPAV